MIGNDLLNQIILEKQIHTPSKILNDLHSGVRFSLKQNGDIGSSRDGMDMALCKINLAKKELEFSGAVRPLWIFKNGKTAHADITEIKGDIFGIGGVDIEYAIKFKNNKVSIDKGDTIYLSSDGFIDQFGGPKNKRFMKRRFLELLTDIQKLNL